VSRRRSTRLEPLHGADRTSSMLGVVSGVLGGLGLLLLVALVGPGVAGSGDDGGVIPLPPAEIVTEASTEAEGGSQAEQADEAVALPIVAENIYLSRDPFEPVVPEDEPANGGNGGNGTTGGGTNGGGTNGDGSTDPGGTNGDPVPPPTPDADSTCMGSEELVCDGQVVTLEGTSGSGESRTASIKVNSTTYVVSVGETFATNFILLGFDGDCVNIAYGPDELDIERQLCQSLSPLK